MTNLPDQLTSALAYRYTIERELGRGGMAVVYLARDLKHDRKVAIKVLRPELAATLGAERFLREIKIAARLNHPHILPLLDSGSTEEQLSDRPPDRLSALEPSARPSDRPSAFLYYVMPYIEGESLRDRLTRERQLPIEDALALTREVASALSYAHEQGVIHRDIKPENIMLSAGGAVVADFGIARAVDAAGGATLTETDMAVGTPAYMSPEQATAEEVDGRSDIYSLACVTYEMLAGEAPYSAPTPQAVIAKKLSEPTPRISVVREMVPETVEAVLTRALAKNPVDRYATPQEFTAELLRPSVQPDSSGVEVPPAGQTRRKKVRLGIAAGFVIAAAVFVVALMNGGVGSRPAQVLGSSGYSLEADRLLRQALGHWRTYFNLESLHEGSALLERALEIDPESAEAMALLALFTSVRANNEDIPPQEGYERVRELAAAALRLDSTVGEAHFAAAFAAWTYNFDWEGAARHFAAAVALKPQYPWLLENYGALLIDLGRRDEILRLRALKSDTAYWAYQELFLGELRLARDFGRSGLQSTPPNFSSCLAAFWAASLGQPEEALATNEHCGGIDIVQNIGPATEEVPRAYLHALAGRREEAMALLTAEHRENLESMALIHAGLGDVEIALDFLEQAMDKDFVYRLSSHPGYVPLHDHPRFHRLLARMKLACTFEGYRHTCEPLG